LLFPAGYLTLESVKGSRFSLLLGVLLGALSLPSPAGAAGITYFAEATGGRTTPPCIDTDPCTIQKAVEFASSGDEVVALAGTYTGTSLILDPGLSLRGAAGSRPTLQGTSNGVAVTADTGARVSHLRIENGRPLQMHGAEGFDLVLAGTTDSGAFLLGASRLRDSLVMNSAVNNGGGTSTAIHVGLTGASTAQIRNVTAIATGANSYGVRVWGAGGPPPCFPSDARAAVRNTIARGTTGDLTAIGTTAGCVAAGVLDVAHSNFRQSTETTGGDVIEGAGNQKTPAQTDLAAIFADTVNYRQIDGAPTYNAGEQDASDSGMVDPDGDPRVGDGRVDIGADELPSAPVVITDPPASLEETSATMAGRVNPSGRAAAYKFEYGPDASLGSETSETTLDAAQQEFAVSAPLAGLVPGQTVFYRLRARAGGHQPRSSVSQIVSFTTPSPALPDVFTGEIGALSVTSAVLTGTVDPNRRETTWRFVYGPTTAYGAETATVSAGAGDAAAPVAATVEGLTPGTLYHYRLEATNELGTATGADATFTTLSEASSPDTQTPTPTLTLSALTITPKRFQRGSALPKIAATGARIRFTLSEAARVKFVFFRKQPGRRVGNACKRPTRANRNNKRCTRLVKKGTLSFDAAAGARTVRFSGRLTKKRSLPLGRYKLVASATDPAGTVSRPASAGFRLLRKR
jgi:hypothetical protein